MSKQLPVIEFVAELLRTWRQMLAPEADIGHYRSADVDCVIATLRADFVHLPILRFLGLDPIQSFTEQPELFRWAQAFCMRCKKQDECSLMSTNAVVMPPFEEYCSNASRIRQLSASFPH